jgi:mannose-6-phosphate isomerase-like protein (cupin superfamily)
MCRRAQEGQGIMADKWEETSVRGDIGSVGMTSTHSMRNTETGDVKEVCVNSGTREYEMQQVGEQIAKGGDSNK